MERRQSATGLSFLRSRTHQGWAGGPATRKNRCARHRAPRTSVGRPRPPLLQRADSAPMVADGRPSMLVGARRRFDLDTVARWCNEEEGGHPRRSAAQRTICRLRRARRRNIGSLNAAKHHAYRIGRWVEGRRGSETSQVAATIVEHLRRPTRPPSIAASARSRRLAAWAPRPTTAALSSAWPSTTSAPSARAPTPRP